MKLKFAKKSVNGWANRYLNQREVFNALGVRMKNGFTLTAEEKKFYDDVKSLTKIYKSK
jgi:hypothetical protein